jgi:hypothetical protein
VNYIWELLIRAENEGYEMKDISFRYPTYFSPYMELSFTDINTNWVLTEVEVNPYFRYFEIFSKLFDINLVVNLELRTHLFDILIHFLGNIDRLQGMNKREYYIFFTVAEITAGIFGTDIQKKYQLFTETEKEIIASGVLSHYKTGEGVYIFKRLVQEIFISSSIFANAKEKNELIIYINAAKTTIKQKKIKLLSDLFLPFQFEIEVYWENIFGIIEMESFMKFDSIVIY